MDDIMNYGLHGKYGRDELHSLSSVVLSLASSLLLQSMLTRASRDIRCTAASAVQKCPATHYPPTALLKIELEPTTGMEVIK